MTLTKQPGRTHKWVSTLLPAACFLLTAVMLTGCRSLAPQAYPGFTRNDGSVFLMENHSSALAAWHLMSCTNATLVHVDAHDDIRFVPEDKVEAVRSLLQKEALGEVYRKSDTCEFLSFRIRNADQLFDLGSFIYPSMELGLVSNMFWIVPEPAIQPDQQRRISRLLLKNLPGSEVSRTGLPAGGFEVIWRNRSIKVITLESLPQLPENTVLDIDLDFFTFPRALTDSHLISQVNRNPPEVFAHLRSRICDPKATTLSASVWGGYLPLLLRFLADAAFDYYTTGNYPDYATQLLASYKSLKTGTAALPPHPSSDTYVPAYLHLQAMHSLSKGEIAKARAEISDAAGRSHVYRKGMLDISEALISLQQYSNALEFAALFDSHPDGPTYNSTAIRAMALLASGSCSDALLLTKRLTDWDINPYTQLLHGSTLLKMGHEIDAMKSFRRVLDADPMNASAHYNMGLLYEAHSETNAAINAYTTAASANPSMWQASDNLGHLLLSMDRLAEAEKALRLALRANPLSITAINNLGLALARQGRLNSASEIFQRGLQASPDNPVLGINLAETLMRSGKHNEAAEICRKLIISTHNSADEVIRNKAEEILIQAEQPDF